MTEIKLGTGSFIRRTRVTTATMRVLEAAGVIHPVRSDSGWRQFSEADVVAALKWRHERKYGRDIRASEPATA
jgi:DNA-binding transcriptional MerR regulator